MNKKGADDKIAVTEGGKVEQKQRISLFERRHWFKEMMPSGHY
jgi:hypothetical protein